MITLKDLKQLNDEICSKIYDESTIDKIEHLNEQIEILKTEIDNLKEPKTLIEKRNVMIRKLTDNYKTRLKNGEIIWTVYNNDDNGNTFYSAYYIDNVSSKAKTEIMICETIFCFSKHNGLFDIRLNKFKTISLLIKSLLHDSEEISNKNNMIKNYLIRFIE